MEQNMNSQERTELLAAQAQLGNLTSSYMKTYAVKAAIELGIADIIHRHGQPVTASQLATKIPISNSVDVSCLDRLMRFLAHTGVFKEERQVSGEGAEGVLYGLTAISKLLLQDSPYSRLPVVRLILHPFYVSSWDSLATWLRSDEGIASAFEAKHGAPFWTKASLDPAFSKLFNEAMSGITKHVIRSLVEGCGEVFEGISSLVDVGGGTGTAAAIIADAFPYIKCMVLDLPHVVASSSLQPNVVTIEGDMFDWIPPADAVFLKGILHDWDDEECIKILTRCKEAIPKPRGKVIIAETVWKKYSDPVLQEMLLTFDFRMMVMHNGKERNEQEWNKLFTGAGFSSYKIVTTIGPYSIIEVFP